MTTKDVGEKIARHQGRARLGRNEQKEVEET
jgi:hypothetical protein